MFAQDLINKSKPLAFSNLPTARACSSLFIVDMISLTSKLIQFVTTLKSLRPSVISSLTAIT